MPANPGHGNVTVDGYLQPDFAHLPMFTWPFYLMTVITLLAPLAPAVLHLRKHPIKLVRYLTVSVAIHLSLICCQFWDILITAVTGKNSFPATGDHACDTQLGTRDNATDFRRFNIINALGVSALFTAAIISASTGFLPICLAMGVGIAVNTLGWKHALVRVTLVLPFTVIILLIALSFYATVGLCGASILATAPGF